MNEREVLRTRLMGILVEALADPSPDVVFELADRLAPTVEKYAAERVDRERERVYREMMRVVLREAA